MTASDLKQGIEELLDRAFVDNKFTTLAIIRGGAHLALLYAENHVKKGNVSLLLEHLLDLFPLGAFAGRSFLVVDDSVYRGSSLERTRSALISRGVSVERIKTAALVIHKDCPKERLPDYYLDRFVLDGPAYRSAADSLNQLARHSLSRPIGADHALYHFDSHDCTILQLFDALASAGHVRAVDRPNDKRTRLTVDVGDSVVNPLAGLRRGPNPRIDLAKFRVYAEECGEHQLSLTIAPLVYPTGLNSDELLRLVKEASRELGLTDDHMTWAPTLAGRYFMSCTILGFLMLVRLFEGIRPHLPNGARIEPVAADHRLFLVPGEYEVFYGRALEILNRQPVVTPVQPELPLDSSRRPFAALRDEIKAATKRTRMSSTSLVAVHVGKASRSHSTPLCYHDLVEQFGDESVVSSALDGLLDCGILKPQSECLDPGGDRFGRYYHPSGEQRRIQVERMAELLDLPPAPWLERPGFGAASEDEADV